MKKYLLILLVIPSFVFSQTREQLHNAATKEQGWQPTGKKKLVWGMFYFSAPDHDFHLPAFVRTQWYHNHATEGNSRLIDPKKYFWDKDGKIPMGSDTIKMVVAIDTATVKRKR